MAEYRRPPSWSPSTVEWWSIDGEGEPGDGVAGPGDVLLATVYLFNTPMHMMAVRIDPTSDEQKALNDPHDRLEGLYLGDQPGCPYLTTQIPGYDGEYVVWLVPHGD